MKPGELRRFTQYGAQDESEFGPGDIFMVLEINSLHPRSSFPKQVTFLVGDRIEKGWGLPWIMTYSEALDETG